jgi:hypothetical protein
VNVDRPDRWEGGLRARIAQDLVVWGLPARLAAILFLTPLPAVPLGLYLSFAHPRWFDRLTDEDHLVEWLQVVELLVALGAFALLARHHWKAQRRISAVVSVLAVVAIFFITGEEISWGQRILGWATPAALQAINDQGEANIHNIRTIASTSRLVQFGAVAYGAFAPLLMLLPRLPRRVRYSYFIPPLPLVSFFVGPFVYWAVRIPIDPTAAIFRVSEITELSAYGGLAVLGWLSLGRFVLGIPSSDGSRSTRAITPRSTAPPGAP